MMELSKQDRLIAVYEDTQAYYTENPTLAEAVKKSRDHTVFTRRPAERTIIRGSRKLSGRGSSRLRNRKPFRWFFA